MRIKQTLNSTVYGVARPQGSKKAFNRGGRIVLVEASNYLKDWRAQVANQIGIDARRQNWDPVGKDEPVHVSIRFVYVKPKTAKRLWATVKPDLDKNIRAILDAIGQSKAVWIDDSQVVSIFAVKEYGDDNLVEIEIANGN